MTLNISSDFDAGNIRVVSTTDTGADLEIVQDHLSDFYQWFYFRVDGAAGRTLSFRILNAAGAAYPAGWPGYKARLSTDNEDWRMTETSYADGVLTITVPDAAETFWLAYFAPYSSDRHTALVERIAAKPGVQHDVLGATLDGRPIDRLTIGAGPKHVWLYARQHPGESMAEWWAEGALEKLTDPADATAQTLREKATIHVVPNLNPDGSARGHLRTNAAGVNLNREWHAPSPEKSPEVLAIRNAMDKTGVAFAMDVHGDEAIPANFLAGFEGIPSWTDAHGRKFYDFAKRLEAATPEFQTEQGYVTAAPGKANLSMSTNQLAERFGAVSMTLEMPFKDHDKNADPVHGWSPERSKALAASCLDVLAGMIDEL